MVQGRTVRLFLVEGTPSGIITAEIMNWTGQVLYSPRSRIAEALKRDETARTGIYLLIGDDPDNPTISKVYIGESDTVRNRIRSHVGDDQKEFWTHACMITSTDRNLTKAHIRYLEGRLLQIAKKACRASIANETFPEIKDLLPESDASDMEFFLDQLRVIMPVIGIDLLRTKPKPSQSISSGILELQMRKDKYGYHAEAVEQDGELTVLKDSTAPSNPPHKTNGYAPLRNELIESGVIAISEINPDFLVFLQDFTFKSPSAAASVINGRSTNGRTEWFLKGSKQTLKQFQDAQLKSISESSNNCDESAPYSP